MGGGAVVPRSARMRVVAARAARGGGELVHAGEGVRDEAGLGLADAGRAGGRVELRGARLRGGLPRAEAGRGGARYIEDALLRGVGGRSAQRSVRGGMRLGNDGPRLPRASRTVFTGPRARAAPRRPAAHGFLGNVAHLNPGRRAPSRSAGAVRTNVTHCLNCSQQERKKKTAWGTKVR